MHIVFGGTHQIWKILFHEVDGILIDDFNLSGWTWKDEWKYVMNMSWYPEITDIYLYSHKF